MSGEIKCPKCGSSQIHSDKRGFKAGRAVAGTLIAGPLAGAVTGAAGKNQIRITCLACGHQFKPGEGSSSSYSSSQVSTTNSTNASVRKTFKCDNCGKITTCFDRVPCPSCGNRMTEVEGATPKSSDGNLSGGTVILIIALFIFIVIIIATCS